MRSYSTYMMAIPSRIVYIGVTGDLERRVWQHKNNLSRGFVRRYGCKKLVWEAILLRYKRHFEKRKG